MSENVKLTSRSVGMKLTMLKYRPIAPPTPAIADENPFTWPAARFRFVLFPALPRRLPAPAGVSII